MTRQQSEGEVHVEAMRLILAEMERREDIPDWTIWQHMLNMLETIFQGIVDQRADDADEIETLRKELAATNRFASTVASERDAAHAAAMAQQRDETVYYLQARLDEERSVIAGLREQVDAARAAVTLQRAAIERQSVCIGKVRVAQNSYQWPASWNKITAALAELDGEPAPVAEPVPCPECERLQVELTKSKDWASHCEEVRKDKSAELGFALEECGRLRAFVEKVRSILPSDSPYSNQLLGIEAALNTLDADTEPTPVVEPLDAEGGK